MSVIDNTNVVRKESSFLVILIFNSTKSDFDTMFDHNLDLNLYELICD